MYKWPISTTLLAIKEMQSKTTMRYQFTPTIVIIVVIIQEITSTAKDVEKLQPSYNAGENGTTAVEIRVLVPLQSKTE